MKDYKKYKKHLRDYIKENISKGYSIQAIEKALLIYGYEKDLVGELIRNYKLKNIITKSVPLALLLLLIPLFFYIKPNLVGYAVKETGFNFTDGIGLIVNESYEYIWDLENKGQLKSVRLNGKVAANGFVKVYLEYENETYLIFDNKELEKGLEEITAFAIKEDDKDKENDKEGKKESDKEKKNNKPDWTSGVDTFIINSTTTINLSQHFTDEDGDALLYSASEVDGLEITISNEIATIKPTADKDFNTTITFTASDGIDIKNEIVDLIVIVEKEVANRAPIWISETDTFVINGTTTINLSQYFIDEDNDALTYSSGLVGNITITIDNELITLIPHESFAGSASTVFTAFDGKNLTIKNVNLIVPERVVINVTEPINITPINKSIAIELQYNKNTPYDVNDDGIESIDGIIDFTVENTKFNWDYNENNLCARWEIYSIEDDKSTTVCYGSGKCCNFIGLEPAREQWNEILYLTYGQYGAAYSNIVSAQVIYADYNLSIGLNASLLELRASLLGRTQTRSQAGKPFAEIYYSDWQNLSAKFLQGYISFENICIETCILPNLNATSYKLKFEIDNSSLVLDNISYEIFGYEKINKVPILLKNFSNMSIFNDQSYALNLSEYFYDEDNDTLTYSFYNNSAIDVLIANETAALIPVGNFTGKEYMFFIANDGIDAAISNIFEVEVKQRERILKSLRRLIGV